MQLVLLHGADLWELMQRARERTQPPCRQRGRLPYLERHAFGIFCQQLGIHSIGLTALHHGFGKVPHRAWIGHHDLHALLRLYGQGQVQTVQAGGLHADPHSLAVTAHIADQLLVARGGVSKFARAYLSVAFQSYYQNFGTDLNSYRIYLVHSFSFVVGLSSGFPTLYRLRPSLNMQASCLGFSPVLEKRAGGLSE